MRLLGSVFMVAEDQSEASREGLPVILRRAGGGMKRCGSSRAGSVKRDIHRFTGPQKLACWTRLTCACFWLLTHSSVELRRLQRSWRRPWEAEQRS